MSFEQTEWVTIGVQVIRRETDLAFNVIADNNQIYWIPKSQVDDPDSYSAGDRDIEMRITRWIADEKEIA